MILNVMAEDGLPVDEIFPVFQDLFERRELARSRWAIMNIRGHFHLRFLPRGLVFRLTCDSDGTCKGNERKSRLIRPLPGVDDE